MKGKLNMGNVNFNGACVAAAVSLFVPLAFAGTEYLGGNAVLDQLTRVDVKSSSADSVTFAAAANAKVGVLDWSKFNIGSGQSMGFSGMGTTFFNLVNGPKSQIDGIINGNGNVWVINPSGIAFGANASVNVDGVFAAAAGAIGNADALREGTASLPVFDSFSGHVDATKGTFVADQIALLGKTVAAGGEADFSGVAKVDVGAGENLVVDDIGGGMVSVDIEDFAESAEDVVDISSLVAGDAIVDVVANGNAKLTGDIDAGRLQVFAANDVTVDAEVGTSLDGFSAASINKGSVTVAGNVWSATEVALVANDGDVTVHGALGGDNVSIGTVSGDILIDTPDVEGSAFPNSAAITANNKLSIAAGTEGTGNVRIESSLEAENGISVTAEGTVTFAGSGEREAGAAIWYGELSVVAGIGGTPGDIVLDNYHFSGMTTSDATFLAKEGGISGVNESIGAFGKVQAEAKDSVSLSSLGALSVTGYGEAVVKSSEGSVTLAALSAHGPITVEAAQDISISSLDGSKALETFPDDTLSLKAFGGDVTVGSLDGQNVSIEAGGDIIVKGDMTATDRIVLLTKGGDIAVHEGISVTATGDGSLIEFSAGTEVQGGIRVDGALQADTIRMTAHDGLSVGDAIAKGGDVEISTVRDDIVINGTVKTEAENGTVFVKAATEASARGSIIVNGQLLAPATGGRVIGIAGYGKLKAEGKISGEVEEKPLLKAAPRMLLAANRLLGSGESEPSVIQINNRADVMAKRLIILEGESGVHSEGTIDIREVEAELQVFGHEGDIDLYENDTGVVLAYKATFVTTGDILVDNPNNSITEVVEARSEEHGEVKIETGDSEGEVVIGGGVQGESIHIVHRKGRIVIQGDVEAPDQVILETEDGDIIVAEGGSVKVTGEGSVIALRAGSVGNGSLDVKGDLEADTVTLVAKDHVTVDPDVQVTAGNGNLTIVSDGSVEVGDRAALAANGDVMISADGSVETGAGSTLTARGGDIVIVSGGEVNLGGPVAARGGVVDMAAKGDISLGDVSSDAVREETTLSGERQLVSVRVVSEDGRVTVREEGTVESTHREGPVLVMSKSQSPSRGGVTVEGTVAARGADAYAQIDSAAGEVEIKGAVESEGQAFVLSDDGDISVRGRVTGGTDALVENRHSGNVTVNGSVDAGDTTFVVTKNGNVTVNGRVRSRGVGEINGVMASADRGSVTVNGEVSAGGSQGLAIVKSDTSGNVVFGANGHASGSAGVVLKTGSGDVIQRNGDATRASGGYASVVNVPAAVSGKDVVMDVKGSVRSDRGGYFGVNGKVFGKTTGDMRVAAANGADMEGGSRPTDSRAYDIAGVDFSGMGDNQSLVANGNLSAYTAGALRSYGLFSARGKLDISAASFGDLSYLRADGGLAVNNVGRPGQPQIAYFEGIEPRIDNQPNDTLIFVNGRLAGGNLQMISKMGAMEAFPVSTPELKSEQGIFGNPVFLHGDLDVAEPMAVGCVDYLIQEIPRLLLSGDFPIGVDRNVQTAGLNPKDIYRFGLRSIAERKAQEAEGERMRPAEEGDEATQKPEGGEKAQGDDGRVVSQ